MATWGPTVGGIGGRLHFGRPKRRPGGPTVGYMGCRLCFWAALAATWESSQLSGVWAVVCILGGPGGDLGIQVSGYALSFTFWAVPTATWGSNCREYELSFAFRAALAAT